VLARVLGEACRQAVEGHLELLARLAEDRELLVGGLLGGIDPGALTGVEPGGDPTVAVAAPPLSPSRTAVSWSTSPGRSNCTRTSTTWSRG